MVGNRHMARFESHCGADHLRRGRRHVWRTCRFYAPAVACLIRIGCNCADPLVEHRSAAATSGGTLSQLRCGRLGTPSNEMPLTLLRCLPYSLDYRSVTGLVIPSLVVAVLAKYIPVP